MWSRAPRQRTVRPEETQESEVLHQPAREHVPRGGRGPSVSDAVEHWHRPGVRRSLGDLDKSMPGGVVGGSLIEVGPGEQRIGGRECRQRF